MKSTFLARAIHTALSLGLASAFAAPASGAAIPRRCPLPDGGTSVRGIAWTVVRVSVDRAGDVRDARVVWESGNRDVTSAALTSATLTTIEPGRATARSRTFDDLFVSACGGTPAHRLLPRLGDPLGTSLPAVHVRSKRAF